MKRAAKVMLVHLSPKERVVEGIDQVADAGPAMNVNSRWRTSERKTLFSAFQE